MQMVSFRWNSLGYSAAAVFGFLRFTIVAIVVGPEQVGELAIAMSMFTVLVAVSGFGVRQLYVSGRLNKIVLQCSSLVDAVWFTQVALCTVVVVFGAVVTSIASIIGMHSNALYMAFGLTLCLLPLSLHNVVMLEDEMKGDFKRISIIEASSQTVSTVFLCLMTFVFISPWLLVISRMFQAVLGMSLSYSISPVRKMERVRLSDVLSILKVGKPVLKINIATFITQGFDKLVLSFFVSNDIIGFYYTAQRVVDVPLGIYVQVMTRSLLPEQNRRYTEKGLSIIQDDSVIVYRSVFIYVAAIIIALFVAWRIDANYSVLGEWALIYPLVYFVVGIAYMRACCQLISPMLMVIGKVELDSKMKIQECVVYLPALIIFSYLFGLYGVLFVSFILYFVSAVRRHNEFMR